MHIIKSRSIKLSTNIIFIGLMLNIVIWSYQTNTYGKTIYVDGAGGTEYTRIQDAVNNTTDGDIIYVYYGIYNENVVIKTQIEIIGFDKPIINGTKEEDTTFTIFVDNVTLNGFIIMNSNSINITKGVYIKSDNNKITNCSIINLYRGIYIYRAENNLIYNNTFEANKLDGIDIIRSDNNHIMKNDFYNSGIYAINLWNANKNIIEKNNVNNNIDTGIYISSSSNNTIKENTLQNNSKYGIALLLGSNNNIIYYNNFINNNIQSTDECINIWHNITTKKGNYWSEYESRYNDAVEQNGTWSIPYNISDGINQDFFPLVKKYVPQGGNIYKDNKNNILLDRNGKNENNIFLVLIVVLVILFIIIVIIRKIKEKK